MGQYKVPQDVEAEDKIIGFLTLKQFLYATMGVMWGGLSFALFYKISPFLMILVGAPPTILLLMLGLVRRQDQPFEVFFVSLMNYLLKPRFRIWRKEPIEQVFHIQPPEVVEDRTQKDPSEVRGQLDRLAAVVDTRGYSTKQPEIQEPMVYPEVEVKADDRLFMPEDLGASQEPVIESDVRMADDILDFDHNAAAASLNVLIENTVKDIRQEAIEKMRQRAAEPGPPTPPPASDPVSTSGMTPVASSDILKLAKEGDDLTVSQLASQANRYLAEGQPVDLRNGSAS